MHQMHEFAQFEYYAKFNWEPVQTMKRGSAVFSCSSAGNKSGGRVLVARNQLTTEKVLSEWSCTNPFLL